MELLMNTRIKIEQDMQAHTQAADQAKGREQELTLNAENLTFQLQELQTSSDAKVCWVEANHCMLWGSSVYFY